MTRLVKSFVAFKSDQGECGATALYTVTHAENIDPSAKIQAILSDYLASSGQDGQDWANLMTLIEETVWAAHEMRVERVYPFFQLDPLKVLPTQQSAVSI